MSALIVLDIETLAKPVSEEAKAEKLSELNKKYKTPSVIEEHLAEWTDKQKFKPEGAELLCVGLGTLPDDDELPLYNVGAMASDNPAEPLKWFVEYMNEHATLGHKIVGFNVKAFDLPILALALHRHGLRLKRPLGRYDIIDLCDNYSPFAHRSLKQLSKLFGLPGDHSKSGALVADMWECDMQTGSRNVEHYCKEDVVRTGELYRALNRMYAL